MKGQRKNWHPREKLLIVCGCPMCRFLFTGNRSLNSFNSVHSSVSELFHAGKMSYPFTNYYEFMSFLVHVRLSVTGLAAEWFWRALKKYLFRSPFYKMQMIMSIYLFSAVQNTVTVIVLHIFYFHLYLTSHNGNISTRLTKKDDKEPVKIRNTMTLLRFMNNRRLL